MWRPQEVDASKHRQILWTEEGSEHSCDDDCQLLWPIRVFLHRLCRHRGPLGVLGWLRFRLNRPATAVYGGILQIGPNTAIGVYDIIPIGLVGSPVYVVVRRLEAHQFKVDGSTINEADRRSPTSLNRS